jgi:PAS domain S-box-containing protein
MAEFAAKANILLVDDQEANLLALKAVLSDLGHNLVEAHSGEEAVCRLAEDDFAVVLLDIQMPRLDGFQTAQMMRSLARARQTPIIFLTAFDSDQFPVEQAYSLGAVDYLVKPIVPIVLKAKVTGFIDLFEKTQEVRRQSEQLRRVEREQFARSADEQREWFRVTLSSIGDAVITTDTQGLITFTNTVAQDLTGWDESEAVGKPLSSVFRIIHEDGRHPIENPVTHVLREGRVVGLGNHTLLVDKNGNERPIDDSAAPIKDADGSIRGVVLIFRDVGEQRKAERKLRDSEEELSDFFDNATIGLHWVGADGTILRANRSELELLGYEPEEYVGHHIAEFHADQDVIDDILRRLQAGEKLQDYPAQMRCKDGSLRDVLIHSSVRWENDTFLHTRCFTRDVTEQKRAQEEMRRLERRNSMILESITDAFWSVDRDWNFVYVNHKAEELLSRTRESLLGKHLWTEYAAAVGTVFEENYRRAVQDKVTIAFEAYYGPHDRWYEVHAYPSPDGLSVYFRDASERRKGETALRESEEKFRLLADTIPQLCWMARPDGYIFWYNRGWHEYTGKTAAEMEGWGWQSVHDAATLPAVLNSWKGSIASGEPFEMVFPLRGADGHFRPFLTRVNPLRDQEGHILYWFGTNTDVSEIKAMEASLRLADQRKDEFLATLAHELRNPLAPIRNSLTILNQPNVDAETIMRTREMMERQVQLLIRLVDDLLDVSRVMRGKIELRKEHVELSLVVARAVETVKPTIDAIGHQLLVTLPFDPLFLDADPLRLAQVLGNLLTNASKYTEANGRIALTASREGNDAVLRVQDNGIGIAADMLPSIFDLFVQADHAATRSQGGLGIGLTLVKNLVEMHGGSVEAYSEGLGTGSLFVLRLPLSVQQSETPTPRLESPALLPRSSGHRLLVVDDNRDAANSLAMLLRIQGYEVRVAHGGAEAFAIIKTYTPQMVFLDIGMPGMDGYEVARKLRAQPGLESVVIAAVTGWGQEEDRRRSKEAGFDHHLVKPPEPKAVQQILSSLGAARTA